MIDARAGEFRRLVGRVFLRDPDSIIAHRACAASYLFVPAQPRDAYFHRPPFGIPANELGLTRQPISWKAYEFTRAIYVWAEPNERLWLTWRPALPLIAALAVYLALARRRDTRRLLVPGALLLFLVVNVAVTTPAQEFRFAFGIYLVSWLSLPLLAMIRDGSATRAGADQGGAPSRDRRRSRRAARSAPPSG